MVGFLHPVSPGQRATHWPSLLVLLLTLSLMTGGPPTSAQLLSNNADWQNPPSQSLIPDRTAIDDVAHTGSVMFVENVGQWDPRARFQVWGAPGDTMWLAQDAIWITLVRPLEQTTRQPWRRYAREEGLEPEPRLTEAVHLKLSFPGANAQVQIEPFDRLDTSVSYFLGSDPEKWRSDVPIWGGVRYVDLYPALDLNITGKDGCWMWSISGHESALSQMRLRMEGADSQTLTVGQLQAVTHVGVLDLPMIQVEQTSMNTLEQMGGDLIFPFASTDKASCRAKEGIASVTSTNPIYATFLGGMAADTGSAIAVDNFGQAYMVGSTESVDFPAALGPGYDTSKNAGNDTYVAKFNAAGTALLYASFIGGASSDYGSAVAVDAAGQAYMTGMTQSKDFPAASGPGYDTTYNGDPFDAFAVKLNATGTALLFATYLGGSAWDHGDGIAVDSAGMVYVVGNTQSTDFPAARGPGYDTTYNGGWFDAFVVKLSTSGTSLLYATYLGGTDHDDGRAIAVDSRGQATVAGTTGSASFPAMLGPGYDTSFNGGGDAYVMKLGAEGTTLLYASFIGGTLFDYATAVAVDDAAQAYVTGATQSTDFPAASGPGHDTRYDGGTDAFVVKLDAMGTLLLYASFLGGTGYDDSGGIAVDSAGQAYIVGSSNSASFPLIQGSSRGSGVDGGCTDCDAFVAKLDVTGSTLLYSTALRGADTDLGSAVALDSAGHVYLTGQTFSVDFPAARGPGYDTTYNGAGDAYVMKLDSGIPVPFLHPIDNLDCNGGYAVSWSPITDAFRYELQEDDDSAFLSPTFVYSGPSSSWNVTNRPSGVYYYRVRACSTQGCSTWSNIRSVQVRSLPSVPLLYSIDNPDLDGNYTVRWTSVADVENYRLEEGLGTSPAAWSTAYYGPNTSWSVAGRSVGSYSYRVRAENCRGQSVWSGIQSVVVLNRLDYWIQSIDVVQVVLTDTAHIPLVAEKPTLVRVHARVRGADQAPARVSLSVKNATGHTLTVIDKTLHPSSTSAWSGPRPDQDEAETFNFLLTDPALITDSRSYLAEVQPAGDATEANPADNTLTTTVSFSDPARAVRVGWVPFRYGEAQTGERQVSAAAKEMLQAIYPGPITFTRIADVLPISVSLPYSRTDYLSILKRWWLTEQSHLAEPPDRVYGVVPDEAYPPGIWQGAADARSGVLGKVVGTGRVAVGPPEAGLLAHEMLHLLDSYGLAHAKWHFGDPACLELSWPQWKALQLATDYDPNDTGLVDAPGVKLSINGTDSMWQLWYPGRLVVTPIPVYDVMTYCDPRWISVYNYRKLLSGFEDFATIQAQTEQGHLESAPAILVSGSVYTGAMHTQFDPIVPLGPYAVLGPDPGSEYCLEQRSGTNTLLDRHCFDLSFLDYNTGQQLERADFARTLQYLAGTSSIVLTRAGEELGRITASARPPTIRLLAPNGGEFWGMRGMFSVRWQAEDSDGDPLSVGLYFSADDGTSWVPIALDLRGDQADLDLSLFQGTDRARLKAVVTDGFVWSEDVGDGSFRVAPKVPSARILSPTHGAILQPTNAIVLQGEASDIEDGTIPARSLEWRSDVDDVLGYGNVLVLDSLTRGKHLVTLTATDTDGQKGWASVSIYIGYRVYLPALLRDYHH